MRCYPLIIAFLLFVGCDRGKPVNVDDPGFISAMNEGVGLMGRFEFVKAEAAFGRALAQDPQSFDAALDKAIARLNQSAPGAQESALVELESLLKRAPEDSRVNYMAGLALLYLGRSSEAVPRFTTVVSQQPDDPYVQYFLAQALEQSDSLDLAMVHYQNAIDLDPFLRSSWLGLQRTRVRLGDEAGAQEALARFEALASTPKSRLAEFRYSRMGALAMATLSTPPDARLPGKVTQLPPDAPPGTFAVYGTVFGAFEHTMQQLLDATAPVQGSIQVADLDGDGRSEVILAGYGPDRVSRIGRQEDDELVWLSEHPLGQVKMVHCMLFGDVDGNGTVDAFICRNGTNQLMMQDEAGAWSLLPGLPDAATNTVDGALADLDHDGDLDIYCVNDGASNRLLNNNGDGTFADITEQAGVGGDDVASRQVLVADLDLDRDADLVVINRDAPNRVYLNDRLWSYSRSPAFKDLEEESIASAIASYATLDGRAALRVRTVGGELSTWSASPDGSWLSRDQVQLETNPRLPPEESVTLALANFTGDARWEMLVARTELIEFRDEQNQSFEHGASFALSGGKLIDVAPYLVDPKRGPGVLLLTTTGLYHLKPSEHRGGFATVRFAGFRDDAQQMRSNASGIGTRWAARIGQTWQAGATWRMDSGPGQSLQPTAIGMGQEPSIDFIEIDWSDGVFQTELAVKPGPHRIGETQRQISSCPLVFMRSEGEESFSFLTDVLGVGGIGYLLEPGLPSTPRPRESLLLPGQPAEIRLAEPMEEACYLDAVELVAFDVPSQYELVLDERLAIGGPEATSRPLAVRDIQSPIAARNDRGEDVLQAVQLHDLIAVDPGPVDARFIGRLANEYVLELRFDKTLDAYDILMAEGWVEYPYSQTNFAAWQAGATFDAPTLEARVPGGEWVELVAQFGYPAGMPRAMSMPLSDVPAGCTELRLRTNQEVYWDRIRVGQISDAKLSETVVPLEAAVMARCGFPKRTTGPQRQPHYDYGNRSQFGDVRHQAGFYTAWGPCAPLLTDIDDACAIIGPGEEVQLRFETEVAPPADGHTRYWVLKLNGWCKDMDIFTVTGEELEPMPARASDGPSAAAHTLMRQLNTRFASGR